VEAVQKTRAGIVSIKVERRGSWGRKEVGGTGVIVDERGYVVTNRHVVASGSQILVRLAEGGEVAAEVVVDDSRHDLAVLRLSTTRRLSALRFGPSSDLLVGETVIAIGHPYGYTNTVSTGIISALGREVAMPSGEMLRDLIQVTASINPGNSGGPLLNINGELIGINVALREGAQGIAFALNADSVQQVLAGHLSAAKISGVHHGLSCTETTVAEDGPNRQRVVVEEATHAAAAAGVQRGDEVVRIGDRAVCNRLDVERAVWDRKAGEKVAVTVRRDGKEIALAIPLERSGEDRPTVARVSNSPAASPLPVSPIRVEGLRTRKP
jgi:serine protease Do